MIFASEWSDVAMPFISKIKNLRHKDSLSVHGMDARCPVCNDPNDGARYETRRGLGLRGLRRNRYMSRIQISVAMSVSE